MLILLWQLIFLLTLNKLILTFPNTLIFFLTNIFVFLWIDTPPLTIKLPEFVLEDCVLLLIITIPSVFIFFLIPSPPCRTNEPVLELIES